MISKDIANASESSCSDSNEDDKDDNANNASYHIRMHQLFRMLRSAKSIQTNSN